MPLSGAQAQDSLANAAAGSAFNAMQTGNQNVFTGGQLSPALYAAQMAPYDTMLNVGQMEEGKQYEQLQEDLSRFNSDHTGAWPNSTTWRACFKALSAITARAQARPLQPNQNYRSPLELALGYGLAGAGMFF
jgi:hypothetical protein